MKYQTKVTAWLDTPLPNWSLGMDRLDWVSPIPGQNEFQQNMIVSGNQSRFVEDDDRLELTDTRKILYTTYLTLQGAQDAQNLVQAHSIPEWVESIDILERADL